MEFITSGLYWLMWTVTTMAVIVFGGNTDPDVFYPETSEFYYVGATGEPIELINNPNSIDPTYQELITFLRSDKTDEIEYSLENFTCGDFAEMVHNNAEETGIKAAWVCVDFIGSTEGHACNAFNTTDRGLIFVDCTGIYPYEPGSRDCTVKVEIGEIYQPKELFTSGETYAQMGVVKNIELYW
ncbi:hypothetical protein MSHOH_2018 [Methanosarcina horonobensis HB-1 = JCM 15518]|uniref:Uncharacterized protein n=1 Tax=Methanosarcina horonobensis HB-1 = JCM 15518 TaxID=1434110 RepID=A0A0E3SCC3_9EURY|nr:hypothetical protein [Methanosarcina horonobensis]AKB78501.1 hypothetical protein MSHOH_2018 [Methanosarcina horonobensis HB-1 = JCM 15518]